MNSNTSFFTYYYRNLKGTKGPDSSYTKNAILT